MKRWEDVKKNIRSLSQSEKEELEIAARLVAKNTKDQLSYKQNVRIIPSSQEKGDQP